jgi:hypothetical protein
MDRGRFEGSILTFMCMKWINYDLQPWDQWRLQPALRELKTGDDGFYKMTREIKKQLYRLECCSPQNIDTLVTRAVGVCAVTQDIVTPSSAHRPTV